MGQQGLLKVCWLECCWVRDLAGILGPSWHLVHVGSLPVAKLMELIPSCVTSGCRLVPTRAIREPLVTEISTVLLGPNLAPVIA